MENPHKIIYLKNTLALLLEIESWPPKQQRKIVWHIKYN